MSSGTTESFPRQHARTGRFTLGQPRDVRVAPGGRELLFLRSRAGDDAQTCLWAFDVATGDERLVADPAALLGETGEELTREERARRERARETAAGIVGYDVDAAGRTAVFTLSGALYAVALADGEQPRRLPVAGAVIDPHISPDGCHVAYVADRCLHVVGIDGELGRQLAGEDDPDVTWGAAEFVAAEEFGRSRGFWWSPDSRQLLVARVDVGPVQRLWVANPTDPAEPPVALPYPPPGTDNALVSLTLIGLDGVHHEVDWDAKAFPYLTEVSWQPGQPPLVSVLSRDQRSMQVLEVDAAAGSATVVAEDADPLWLDVVAGLPARLADGRLLTAGSRDGSTRLLVGGQQVTPPGLEVRAVLDVTGDEVVFTASEDPTTVGVWRWTPDVLTQIAGGDGVHHAAVGAGVVAIRTASMRTPGGSWQVGDHVIASHAETPVVTPDVRLLTVGERSLRCGLLLPTGHDGSSPLPVLLDPYGGPGAQRVLSAQSAWLTSQWLADQGFAVVVVDGRGTPGRGHEWEHAIAGDFATAVLEDQIDGLRGVAALEPALDLDRVAIRGWSFGGYLAALAVLRRPDVFHAAVAGAPVTDWRLYDTGYTERYLGVDAADAAYDRSSLLDDAPALSRPLMLIHGLADDNVLSAHTLKLSQRLLEAGRAHTVLPLSGVTHMTPQEAVAENLLLLQVAFLKQALGIEPD